MPRQPEVYQRPDFTILGHMLDLVDNGAINLVEALVISVIDRLDTDDRRTTGCTATNAYLARFCCCSEAVVSRAIKKAHDLGLIECRYIPGFLQNRTIFSRLGAMYVVLYGRAHDVHEHYLRYREAQLKAWNLTEEYIKEMNEQIALCRKKSTCQE